MRTRILAILGCLAINEPAYAQVSGAPNYSAAGSDASGAAPTLGTVLGTCIVKTPGGYRFQNQSASTLQLVLDNGLSGTPTVFVYGPGASVGNQGGDSSPEMKWFIGRARVAGAAGSQFALRCN